MKFVKLLKHLFSQNKPGGCFWLFGKFANFQKDVFYESLPLKLPVTFPENFSWTEAATRGVLCKKVFLEISQISQENTCVRVSFLIKLQASGLHASNFVKNETLAHVFSCEFCEISKNTFYTEHLWTTASIWKAVAMFYKRAAY